MKPQGHIPPHRPPRAPLDAEALIEPVPDFKPGVLTIAVNGSECFLSVEALGFLFVEALGISVYRILKLPLSFDSVRLQAEDVQAEFRGKVREARDDLNALLPEERTNAVAPCTRGNHFFGDTDEDDEKCINCGLSASAAGHQ